MVGVFYITTLAGYKTHLSWMVGIELSFLSPVMSSLCDGVQDYVAEVWGRDPWLSPIGHSHGSIQD